VVLSHVQKSTIYYTGSFVPYPVASLHTTLRQQSHLVCIGAGKRDQDDTLCNDSQRFHIHKLQWIVSSGFQKHQAHFGTSLQAGFLCNDARFPERWERHPQFAIGVLVFCLGGYINIQSDATLRKLRQAGGGYQIPYGGMFQHVSSPHYFGEILEWTGFAIASRFSLPSVAFVVYTASNLIPRGLANHTWYLKNFGDKYPRGRHAVIPFLW